MMTFFNETQKIKRWKGGGTPDGRGGFVPFEYHEAEPISLNIQPARKNDLDKLALQANGRDFEQAIIIYSETELRSAGEGIQDGDWVEWRGDWYLVITKEAHVNQFFPISHFKHYAVMNNVKDLQDINGGL